MRYTVLPIPTDGRVPDGYSLIVAYAKNDTVVIPMDVRGLSDEDHNCDWEGCSTLEHVLRISPQQKYELERTAHKAESPATPSNIASLPCLCDDCTRRTLGSCRPNTNSRVTACEGYTKSQQAVA